MGGACSTYGERRGSYRIMVARPEEEGNMENLSVDGSITKEQILNSWDRGTWIGLIWLRIGTDGVLL
jgi:hypothetical protein